MADDAETIRTLVEWASKYEIPLHSQVEVYQDPVTGLSFRARENLSPGTKIVDCSYQISLSYLNAISPSSLFPRHESEPFPPDFIEHLEQEDPHIIGHFFLVQQYLMGKKSFWAPYIKLLPQPDEPERLGIPNWWPVADQRFLVGTNAYPPISIREERWQSEWARGYALLQGRFEDCAAYTYQLYKWAATIYGSRCFRSSLTIPTALVNRSQVIDHIEKDRFAVLFPLMDIGNHNGVDQAVWIPDATTGHLSFLIRDATPKGNQIFNYYGHKHNSELLTAYGFLLPNPEHDKFNMGLLPSTEAVLLRRSQSCHRHYNHTRPEEEFKFQVGTSGRKSEIQIVLSSFSEGLVDTMVCMVANSRESDFIQQNPGYCIEKVVDPFGGPLSRALINAFSTICKKLKQDMIIMEDHGVKLGKPQNKNQQIALKYRHGQLRVIKGAHDLVAEYIQQTISFNCICPHGQANLRMHNGPNFLSLECAYGWLERYYPIEYAAVIGWISEDQNEPLPLNWAIIVEDWDRTYWIVWVLILWMLRKRDLHKFSVEHENLNEWLRLRSE
ncbi:SET domain-containing protein [Stipitochalara longipes BDJ]|nr:SET domain-containing protein [Stipitochalara longipes BDJ]